MLRRGHGAVRPGEHGHGCQIAESGLRQRAEDRLPADLTLPDGMVIPNGEQLPSYVQVNFALSHRFEDAPLGPLVARFDVINAFDKIIELRDGTGVGVFAPQYGPRRGFFAGVTK